ncbi:proton-conducting transporter membrane subunit [Thermus sp.]|uniref:proton-conducting transporter transmembrane domain-containing protein n=1 Tax=Thermus sp. TaxID=275 RepID=UPI00307D025A
MSYVLLLLPLGPTLLALRERRLSPLAGFSALGALLSLVLALFSWGGANGPFRLDGVGLFYLLLTDSLYALVALYARFYFEEEKDPEAWRFFAMGGLFLFALHGAYLTYNLGLLWVFVEGSTLASALLIALGGGSRALEATWKYLLLGSVGIALGLIGVILVYSLLGGTTLDWREALALAPKASGEQLRLAFAFLLIGFGTKVGLFPMQAWLPDAHAEAKSPVSALLSGVLLNVAFYALLRYTALMEAAGQGPFARGLLVAFGLASLLAAALFLFAQTEYKRLLAYSSMEHMGLAVYALGLGLPWLALLHTLFHSLAKTAAFLSAGNILLATHARVVAQVGGLYRTWPALGYLWALSLLALAGLPPFALFWAEFQAMRFSSWPLFLLYGAGLALAFAGLLPVVGAMVFGPERGLKRRPKPRVLVLFPALLLLAVLVLGLFPPVEGVQALTEVLRWKP